MNREGMLGHRHLFIITSGSLALPFLLLPGIYTHIMNIINLLQQPRICICKRNVTEINIPCSMIHSSSVKVDERTKRIRKVKHASDQEKGKMDLV